MISDCFIDAWKVKLHLCISIFCNTFISIWGSKEKRKRSIHCSKSLNLILFGQTAIKTAIKHHCMLMCVICILKLLMDGKDYDWWQYMCFDLA